MYLIHKEINNPVPITAPMFNYHGELRAILRDPEERIVQDTGWIQNSFTDFGKENLHTGFFYMGIGEGSSANSPADTLLDSEVARQYDQGVDSYNAGAAGNYAFYTTRGMRFAPGVGTGMIREVGLYSGGAPGANLYCRQVIPAIDKQAENSLDIYYRVHCTPNIADVTGTVVISGVTYDYTVRPWVPTNFLDTRQGVSVYITGYPHAWGMPNPLQSLASMDTPVSNTGNMYIFEYDTHVGLPYMDWSSRAYLDECNHIAPEGVSTVFSRLAFNGAKYQGLQTNFVALDGPNVGGGIIKTNQQYLTLDWRISWTVN